MEKEHLPSFGNGGRASELSTSFVILVSLTNMKEGGKSPTH